VSVELLACGHVALPGVSRICRHLLQAEGLDHVRLLTGRGLDSDLCCRDCDRAAQVGQPVELLVVCEGCVTRCTDDDWSGAVAWRGAPGVTERPEPFDPAIVSSPLPVPVNDIVPVNGQEGSVWLLLADDGAIGRFDADHATYEVLARCTVPDEPDSQPWAGHRLRRRLHGSADGRYAAVVNDFGRYGQVLDLVTGVVTAELHGGSYHHETVPFSAAFVEHRGRTLVIHRTEWNRLDISDPATGQVLTARPQPVYQAGVEWPDHYLDYFHGTIVVSPGGRRIADDGWVWSPVGMPTVWELRAWLEDNVWESEEGASWYRLCQRAYRWNSPMCWLDDERVVVSGIGGDDDAMLDGVRIFTAATGTEVGSFPGPTGDLFADPARLYAAAPDGLQLWDPVTGHRTGIVQGFVPTRHHTGAGELAAVDNGDLQRWRVPSDRPQGSPARPSPRIAKK
jgi:hypothetical protein